MGSFEQPIRESINTINKITMSMGTEFFDNMSMSMGTEFFDNIKNGMIDKFRQIF